MGLFDYITIDRSLLPGDPPERAIAEALQTKDLECFMREYRVSADGCLTGGDGGYDSFTGTVDAYGSNWRAYAYGHSFTKDGSNLDSVEYQMVFHEGKLVSIKETSRTSEPALPSEFMHSLRTNYDRPELPDLPKELPAGTALYVQWGGSSPSRGYPVTVVTTGGIKNRPQIVVFKESGEFEILDRSSYGATLFLTKEDAEASDKARKDEWARLAKLCEEELAKRNAG